MKPKSRTTITHGNKSHPATSRCAECVSEEEKSRRFGQPHHGHAEPTIPGWASGALPLIDFITEAGWVKRFHAVRTLFPDTVGRHSWGVAVLVWLLSVGECRRELLAAALLHDLTELDWGDMPAPTKRHLATGLPTGAFDSLDHQTYRVLPELKPPALTEEEQRLLHVADAFDGMLHCCGEKNAGNHSTALGLAYARYDSYVMPLIRTLIERHTQLHIRKRWDDA